MEAVLVKVFKRLLAVAFVVGLLFAASYMGAMFSAGKLLGPGSPLSGRRAKLEYKGVQELPGKPRAWVVAYFASRVPSLQNATIYVSLTGTVLATQPADLEARIDAWRRTQEP